PERGLEILRTLGLPLDRMTSALSAGMHQRLRWAWAMLHRPRLLLLDEPLQNLDDPGVAGVTELLRGHLTSGGLAVIANPSSLDLPGVSSRIELVV
ncbi:MAG TPA: ATP-binding cassette domain-containing protein, partial [Thermoanaerobaculia bacterium]|nr:ATP-binding cassette domain-containing protein [Thermoanaerobaculia bacterium]